MDETPPGYLRAAGVVLALWGIGGTLLDYSVLPPGSVTRQDVAIGLVVGISGLGLATGQRWSWFLSLAWALGGVVVGWLTILQGFDITQPGSIPIAIVFLITPSLLLLAALCAPRSWRWLRKRPEHTAIPARPDRSD
jgi:hypothetical protein